MDTLDATCRIVELLYGMGSCDVINGLAVARNQNGTYYVEGCKRRLKLWDAARMIAAAAR